MPHAPLSAEAEFLRVRDELLLVQQDLSRRLHEVADDPRRDLEDIVEVVTTLRKRRDELLMRWGRAGLAFLMKGGEMQLRSPVTTAMPPPRPLIRRPEPTPVRSSESSTIEPSPPPPPFVETATEVEVGPPVDSRALKKLTTTGIAPAWSRAEQTRPKPVANIDVPEVVAQFCSALPPMGAFVETAEDALRELDCLETAITNIDHWPSLPREVQQALVGHVVCRARRLQDEAQPDHLDINQINELDRIFSVMTAYSKREQPGFVFGLMRSHFPSQGNWRHDAANWLSVLEKMAATPVSEDNPERAIDHLRDILSRNPTDDEGVEQLLDAVTAVLDAGVAVDDPRLIRLVAPRLEDLKTQARFKRLRKAIRDAESTAEEAEAEFQAELALPLREPPEGWPLRETVRGRNAVIIGGDLREEARARIQDAFDLASLEWVTTEHTRHIQAVADRVNAGTVNLVILLRRFIGHDVDRIILPACRSAGIAWVSVDRGYGISQIRSAMDRFITEPSPAVGTDE